MTKIKINNNSAEIVEAEFYTSGMVGAKIAFQFSEEWNGLIKTAVFKTDGVQKDVLNVTDVCTIPHECFENAGERLVVGIYGTNGNDVVIPTVYANLGRIKQGADPSGDESTEPSLPVWAQIQNDVSDLDTRVTELEQNGGASVTDDEIIDALYETGIVNPVADSYGAILLASDNNILTF